MKIVVISSYPSSKSPMKGVFVYKLVQEFVKLGHSITVVSPEKFSLVKRKATNYGSELAEVIRPTTFSFSNIKLGKFNTYKLTLKFHSLAIRKAINEIQIEPDVIYCHFLASALSYLQAFPNPSKPIIVAVGEYAWIDRIVNSVGHDFFYQSINKISGFISVSPLIKEKLISLGIQEEKICIEANATDLDRFRPRNKLELRLKYNIPINAKIILYVGNFIETKGVFRVVEALDYLPDKVKAIFLGHGKKKPKHRKIIYAGLVNSEQVADYMTMSDVFVLPSISEGSSNSIIEAIASGLPIVSSNIPEIRLQCTPDFSILVNPHIVAEIVNAIKLILENEEQRHIMGLKATEYAARFDLTARAGRISEYIKNTLAQQEKH